MRSSFAQRQALGHPILLPLGRKGAALGDKVDNELGAGVDGWIRKSSRQETAGATACRGRGDAASASTSTSSLSRTSSTTTSISSSVTPIGSGDGVVLLPEGAAAAAVLGINDGADGEEASAEPSHDDGEDAALPGVADRGHGVEAVASVEEEARWDAPKP
jgi:hypothetical protein